MRASTSLCACARARVCAILGSMHVATCRWTCAWPCRLVYLRTHAHTGTRVRGRTHAWHAGTAACRGRWGGRATVLRQPPADADTRRVPRRQHASHTVLTTRQPLACLPSVPPLRCPRRFKPTGTCVVCLCSVAAAARNSARVPFRVSGHGVLIGGQRGYPQVPPGRHGRALHARGRRPMRALDRAHARQRRAHRPAHAHGGRAVRVWAAQPRPSLRRCGALGGSRRARTAVFVEACVRMGRGSVEQPSATSLSRTGVGFRA